MSDSTMLVVAAGLLVLVALHRLFAQPRCIRCGGRGAHRTDCPHWNRP